MLLAEEVCELILNRIVFYPDMDKQEIYNKWNIILQEIN